MGKVFLGGPSVSVNDVCSKCSPQLTSRTGLNISSLKLANLQRVPRLADLPPRSHNPHLLVYLYVLTLSVHPAVCNSPAYVQLYTINKLSLCGATFSSVQSLNHQIPASVYLSVFGFFFFYSFAASVRSIPGTMLSGTHKKTINVKE